MMLCITIVSIVVYYYSTLGYQTTLGLLGDRVQSEA